MVPLSILRGDRATGCRIGGPCPAGLEQELLRESAQYFGTFPLLGRGPAEFSIFHRFDPRGLAADRDLIDFNNRVLEPGDLIWAVVHAASVRSHDSAVAFEPRGLQLGPESADDVAGGLGGVMTESGNKLGGRAFVERHQVREAVRAMEDDGYAHLLQIGMDPRDLIDGFPWDPGALNVWAKDPLNAATFRFCVQQ